MKHLFKKFQKICNYVLNNKVIISYIKYWLTIILTSDLQLLFDQLLMLKDLVCSVSSDLCLYNSPTKIKMKLSIINVTQRVYDPRITAGS